MSPRMWRARRAKTLRPRACGARWRPRRSHPIRAGARPAARCPTDCGSSGSPMPRSRAKTTPAARPPCPPAPATATRDVRRGGHAPGRAAWRFSSGEALATAPGQERRARVTPFSTRSSRFEARARCRRRRASETVVETLVGRSHPSNSRRRRAATRMARATIASRLATRFRVPLRAAAAAAQGDRGLARRRSVQPE